MVRRASNGTKTPRWLIRSEWHLFLNEANCVTRVVQGSLLLGDTRCVLIIITFFPKKSKCKSQPFLQITIRLQCIGETYTAKLPGCTYSLLSEKLPHKLSWLLLWNTKNRISDVQSDQASQRQQEKNECSLIEFTFIRHALQFITHYTVANREPICPRL